MTQKLAEVMRALVYWCEIVAIGKFPCILYFGFEVATDSALGMMKGTKPTG